MTLPPADTWPAPAVIDGIDVDAVAAAVRGCGGVSALDGGPYGQVASYLPGRKVIGVVVGDDRITVQVRSRWGIPAPDLAAWITVALARLTGRRRIDVVIADIDDPPGAPEGMAAAGTPRSGRPRPHPGLPPT
jgi:hypothetical protein